MTWGPEDPPDEGADAARERDEQARLAREREQADLREVMGTPAGRRLLWRVLSRAGLYRASYVPGMDAMAAAHREGERNVGLWLLAELHAADEALALRMRDEAAKPPAP